MPKAKYAKKEDIPQAEQSLYVEKDGVFLLDVEAVDGLALVDATNLKSALNKERAAKEEALKKLKAFDGIDDAAAARDALKKLEELGDLDGLTVDEAVKKRVELQQQQLAAKFDKDKRAVEEKYAGDLKKMQSQLDSTTGQLRGELVRNQAHAAIAKHGGKSALLMPLIQSRTRVEAGEDGAFVVRVLDERGNPAMTAELGKSGDMSLDEFVGSLKSNAEFAPAFAGSPAGGSGAGAGTGAGGGAGAGRQGGGAQAVQFKSSQLRTPEGQQAYKAARAAQEAGTGPAVQVVEG